jgi:hypothetical protein
MFRKIFSFKSRKLNPWFLVCIGLLLVQMYLSTGTLSAYAATRVKPVLYEGYYVNNDWPQYMANYKFITGADHTEWEFGFVLRRQLLYVVGYPFFKAFGFFVGSMITILLCILFSLFFFFKFIEKEFGADATKIAIVLLCTYTGIMYWIGSPFVQNLITPLCLIIYMLLYKMQAGSFKFNTVALFIIGVLFTGYDLLPLFAPGILLLIFFNKHFIFRQRLMLAGVAIFTFALPQLLIRSWLILRGADPNHGNDESYRIIINAYLNIFNQLPTWWMRTQASPSTLYHCFFNSNFFILPILFLVCWGIGRFYLKFKLNMVERCLLVSVLFLFLFNNMAPPYEGEWQMWGDWLARLYQAAFIVYLMYIIRLSAYIYATQRLKIIFTIIIAMAAAMNIIINTGGLYASPVTSYVYYYFYQHGYPESYTWNIRYYGARPLGFPVHYDSETKKGITE